MARARPWGSRVTLMNSAMLHRIGERDRQLLIRLALRESGARRVRVLWLIVTHLGGTAASLTLSLAPLILAGRIHRAGVISLLVLTASHAVVQLVKRTVVRARPDAELRGPALVAAPDRFSFPSGHAAAAMSVAFGYAVVFPECGALFIAAATLVGASRVVLGVHFPGDVLAGQSLALLTGFVVMLW